jgi:hypothetical protein
MRVVNVVVASMIVAFGSTSIGTAHARQCPCRSSLPNVVSNAGFDTTGVRGRSTLDVGVVGARSFNDSAAASWTLYLNALGDIFTEQLPVDTMGAHHDRCVGAHPQRRVESACHRGGRVLDRRAGRVHRRRSDGAAVPRPAEVERRLVTKRDYREARNLVHGAAVMDGGHRRAVFFEEALRWKQFRAWRPEASSHPPPSRRRTVSRCRCRVAPTSRD